MSPEMTAYLAKLKNRAVDDPELHKKLNVEFYDPWEVATAVFFRNEEKFKDSPIESGRVGTALQAAKILRTLMCHILCPSSKEDIFYMFQQKGTGWGGLGELLDRQGSEFHVCVYRMGNALNVMCGSLNRIIIRLIEREIVPEEYFLPSLADVFGELEAAS